MALYKLSMQAKTMMNTLKLKRVRKILQTDNPLPRLYPRNEPGQQHLSTGQSFTTCPQRTHIKTSTPTTPVVLPLSSLSAAFAASTPTSFSTTNFLSTCNLSFSAMEKYPEEGSNEAKKEQEREVYGKASDDRLSRGFNDNILPHILNMYGSRATAKDFEIYAPDATFEDPLMRAQGIKQIKSAFYSIPKIFSESAIVEYNVKEEEISPGNKEVLIDNKQYYKFMGKGINMISLIKLYIQDGKVVRHEDWWDKKPLWNRDTVKLPLVGRIIEMSRRASMFATHAFMGFGKDPSN